MIVGSRVSRERPLKSRTMTLKKSKGFKEVKLGIFRGGLTWGTKYRDIGFK